MADAKDLPQRRSTLEDAFYQRVHEELRRRLRAAGSSRLRDEALRAQLGELGIGADTIEALVLVPLVEVAWADGKMDERERDAVLRAAEAHGLAPGTPARALLEAWTQERPGPELMQSWREYIGELSRSLSADHRWNLEEQIVGQARAVAEAAGGFLGIAKVSKEEEAVIAQLEAAFAQG